MKKLIKKLFPILLATIFFVGQLPVAGFAQQGSIVCQECGTRNPPMTKFCKECGAKIALAKTEATTTTEIRCPQCGTVNPAGTKFCKECGAKIAVVKEEPTEIRCPECGTVNPAGTKFCKECGYPLKYPLRKRTYRRETKPDEAMLRSLVLPGWGQFYNGQNTKGYIFAGGAGILVLTSFIMYNQAESIYNDYKNGKASYEDYSSKIDTTNTLIGFTAVLWIFNVIDAYINASSGGPQVYLKKNRLGYLSLNLNRETTYLVYTRKF